MTDTAALIVTEIVEEGRYLDAIRYLRRDGMPFTVAQKYVNEVRQGAVWWKRAATRARRARR